MESIFTLRDDIEGKVGIGKLPHDIQDYLHDISKEYYEIIPDKDLPAYHTWYVDLPQSIKNKIDKIQKHSFWGKLCDGTESCRRISAFEMDELYYSNPKSNWKNENLYGALSNFEVHRDCIYNFDGIRFYRILIGLTDGNDNVITNFKNLNIGHKLNSGDYIVFDFDKTTHQVIKEKDNSTPRILLKIHFIVCENCKYSKQYVETIKKLYLYYENITRYIMDTGTNPNTLYEFFWGIVCQAFMNEYTKYIAVIIVIVTTIVLVFLFKMKLVYKNVSKIIKYNFISLVCVFLLVVIFFWSRFKLIGIK